MPGKMGIDLTKCKNSDSLIKTLEDRGCFFRIEYRFPGGSRPQGWQVRIFLNHNIPPRHILGIEVTAEHREFYRALLDCAKLLNEQLLDTSPIGRAKTPVRPDMLGALT